MADVTWKTLERLVSRFFGGWGRTPLSGMNSKHTAADVLHDTLFVEAKQRKRMAIWTLFDKTRELARKEGKTPVVVLHESGRKGFLVVCHCDDLEVVAAERRKAREEA